MPVQLKQPIKPLSEQEFHDLDFRVMRMAFDAHNELGRFCNEKIYQNQLLQACRADGFTAESEVKIQLTHKTFKKDLFIDLLIENGAVYELKVVKGVTAAHRTQALNYLFLTETNHGKIINFNPPSVEHEFVSTSLIRSDRLNFTVCDKTRGQHLQTARKLKTMMVDLLNDWGTFLDTDLYKEAISHFFGGEAAVISPIEIRCNGMLLGTQKAPLISEKESFCISSVKNKKEAYQKHLQRFLNHTSLGYLHWINIDNSHIQFRTLSKENHSDLNYSD